MPTSAASRRAPTRSDWPRAGLRAPRDEPRRDAGRAAGGLLIYGIEPGMDFAEQSAALKAMKAAQVVAFSGYACGSSRPSPT